MKNKKIIIIISICVVLLLILIGCLLFFKKGDKVEEDTNKSNTIINLNKVSIDDSFIAVADKNSKLVIISDNKEIELMDLSDYNGGYAYTYYNGRLYLYLYKYKPGKYDVETGEVIEEFIDDNILGFIDLNDSNYSFNKIDNINIKGYPISIAVAGNNIYYTSSNAGVYKFDTDINKSSVANDLGLDNNKYMALFTISDDKIAYEYFTTSDEESTIGIIDLKSKNKNVIDSNVWLEYIYNNKVIYRKYKDALNWTYYEYNLANGNNNAIGDLTSAAVSSVDLSSIIPFNDYYLFVKDDSIYKYSNDNFELLYKLNKSILEMTLISNNKLYISYNKGYMDFSYGILDLDNLEFNSVDSEDKYSNILYLK